MRTFKKIFSCTLIVLSFILLFTSWVMLTPKAKNASVEYYNEIVQPEKTATSFSQVIRGLQKLDLDEYLGLQGIADSNLFSANSIYNDSGLKQTVNAFADGGLDVTQTALVARTARTIYRYYYEFSSLFGSEGDANYIRSVGALSVYSAVEVVLFILTILLAIAAFLVRAWDRLKNYRKYDLAYFIAQLLLFIMTIIFAGSVNSYSSEFPILGISLWGIIAVILACPSVFLDRIPFERFVYQKGRGAVVNETASAVNGTVSKTVDWISAKVDETKQGVSLSRELKSTEDRLNAHYAQLGKKFFENNLENPPEEEQDAFQEIRDARKQIDQLRRDMDVVNNVVTCPTCSKRWPAGTKFCAECGSKLPDIVEDKEEFDFEMKQKKEKKAGKSFCKYCGAKVEDDDDFCPGCGRSI